jgi:chaperonin cofactor prefoldin
MTVAELKEALKNFDDDKEVYLNIGNNYVELDKVEADEDVGVLLDYDNE